MELQLIQPDSVQQFVVIVCKFKDAQGRQCTGEKHVRFVDAVFRNYMKTVSFLAGGRIVTLLILDGDRVSEMLQLPLRELVQRAERMLNQQCTVGVSRAVDSLSRCGSACFQAITARRYTGGDVGPICFIEDREHGGSSESEFEYVEKSVFTLEQLLKVGPREQLESFLTELYRAESGGHLDFLMIQILATIYRTVSAVSDQTALAELLHSNPIYSKTALYDSDANIHTDLTHLCLDAREIISRYQRRDSELLCDRVLEIIRQEYGDEALSLSGVSARLGVSPNYLSTLMKKTVKKNFSTLLTEQRMQAARDLLLCSSLKIFEVAQKCGYADQHYFSYCFKKFYGISPNKARETAREVSG